MPEKTFADELADLMARYAEYPNEMISEMELQLMALREENPEEE